MIMKLFNKIKLVTSYALVLCTIMMLLMQAYPATAVEITSTKLDNSLIELLDNMSTEDKIDVSVWIKDIDYSAVEKETSDRLKKHHNFNSEKIELLNTGP